MAFPCATGYEIRCERSSFVFAVLIPFGVRYLYLGLYIACGPGLPCRGSSLATAHCGSAMLRLYLPPVRGRVRVASHAFAPHYRTAYGVCGLRLRLLARFIGSPRVYTGMILRGSWRLRMTCRADERRRDETAMTYRGMCYVL